jgi:GTP:adenosylcobinamide-phosphate guanylyltransferase
MRIIIQAGGKGSRLEILTINKPKALLAVDNLPILFHSFEKFKNEDFYIICSYKAEVLENYCKVFAGTYKYKTIRVDKKGTSAGIKEIIKDFSDEEPFMVLWSDLLLGDSFEIPKETGNFIGITKDFECRWSYNGGKFIKGMSKENGVAGLFIFENKSILKDIVEEGAFVEYLQNKGIEFKEIDLSGSKEIGTYLTYKDLQKNTKCRSFNKIEIDGDIVIKTPITEEGIKIAKCEIAWYKKMEEVGFNIIPKIYSYEPLKMERILGRNIWKYDCLTDGQKEYLLKNICARLEELHNKLPVIEVNYDDVIDNYITKTFERLSKINKLVPFADKEFIRINKKWYKNIFLYKEDFIEEFEKILMPKEFHLIHGDCTFSNTLYNNVNKKVVFIDPRGYFGNSKFYGDVDYDWAKLYYSIKGDYDQFNIGNFSLEIKDKEVELNIKTNDWKNMEEYYFSLIPKVNKTKIKLLHSIIWLSLTTYCWQDYDSICGAFYNGIRHAEGIF